MAKSDDTPKPNRLRYWRQRHQLSLREVGEQVGIAYGHLSRIELGEVNFNSAWLLRFAGLFGVRAADLLNLEDGGLTEEERRVIDTLREVPEANRRMIFSVIDSQQSFRGGPETLPLAETG